MSSLAFMPHARTGLRHCLGVQEGERLLIMWDETTCPEFAQACRIAADELGAEASLLVYSPIAYRPLKEYCFFAGASLRPDSLVIPPIAARAMEAAAAVVLLSSDMEMMFSPLIPKMLAAGGRILFVPYLDTPTTRRMLPTSADEVEEQRRLVERCGELFEAGREFCLTSPEGTDLRARLGQWGVRLHRGVAGPGQLTILPAGQVTRVPDDDSAQGVVVIDRTVAANDYKELTEPIVLYVVAGNVTRIEGGMEARLLREFLASLNDPRVYHLTEVSIGTNPKCRFSGLGAPAEDTHKWGTASVALGCDTHIGGGLPGPVHIDMTMRCPSVAIDGTRVVEDGRLLISD